MLTALAERGSERQRERALRTLQIDHSVRSARTGRTSQFLGLRQLRPRARPLLARAIRRQLGAPDDKSRSIYDADNGRSLPGKLVRSEGAGPTGDDAVDEAYDYMGDTFTFYWEAYGRDSIDDAGMPLIGTVHYLEDYDNAFWDGEQMVFGDGDGDVFNRFTIAVDVIGHEMTHGVTEQEAGLVYWRQPGALNESVSDVFGSLLKQAVLQQTADQADWLIGEGLLAPGVNGVALRSMSAPGTAFDDPRLGGRDPQPAHMRDYVQTLEDNGGVHTNSGIPNKAFYLAATAIGGFAWEIAGLIWYQALLSPALTPFAQFSQFAQVTVQSAQVLYGAESSEAEAVRDAWNEVGVRVGSSARSRRAG